MGEFEIIERLRQRLPGPPAGEVWIGDDAAVLPGGWLAATDVVVEGVHFRAGTPADEVGWKAVAVNVSDIAAMGGRPTHLLVTVAGPPETDIDLLYDGIAGAAGEFGCGIAGGDLSGGALLHVSVTVLGTTDGRAPVLRSGARPGDLVYVTGPLGAAAASGYTRRTAARVVEGGLAAAAGATAMIDVSDGLGIDIGHLCDASSVGVELEHVPVAEGATEEQALSGGEDYELVFTLPPTGHVPVGIRIGRCVADPGVRPPASGWQHPVS